MAAEIVAHGPAHRFRHGREIGEKCDWRCGGEAGIFFDEPVQSRDIGAMMAIMVRAVQRSIVNPFSNGVEEFEAQRRTKHSSGRKSLNL